MAKAKKAEETTEEIEAQEAVPVIESVDKSAFVARKLAVLNQKHGAVYERVADRVVQNNL